MILLGLQELSKVSRLSSPKICLQSKSPPPDFSYDVFPTFWKRHKDQPTKHISYLPPHHLQPEKTIPSKPGGRAESPSAAIAPTSKAATWRCRRAYSARNDRSPRRCTSRLIALIFAVLKGSFFFLGGGLALILGGLMLFV